MRSYDHGEAFGGPEVIALPTPLLERISLRDIGITMAAGALENFPRWMVASTLLVQLAVYALGGFIILRLGAVFLAIYLAFILILEYRLVRHHCVNCYYYDRLCCFGRGKICAVFFGKGDPKKFPERKIGWADILPDFLVSLIPLLIGIILLILRFDIILLTVMIALAVLAFPVQGFIRGRWSCRFCRQRELGCPAERLFGAPKERAP